MHPLRTRTSNFFKEATSSFVRKLAFRGLQPGRRATTSMAFHSRSHTNTPRSHDFLINADVYKDYLHKLPHLAFHLIENPPASSFCMACDDITPFELHVCNNCGLTLCGVCQYMITDKLVRGDLKRLIQHVARWKLGYSQIFLEREKAEHVKDWKNYQARSKEEADEKKVQEDIDKLFSKLAEGFAVQGGN